MGRRRSTRARSRGESPTTTASVGNQTSGLRKPSSRTTRPRSTHLSRRPIADTGSHETRPVSQGLIVLEELNLLEGFDLRGLGRNTAETLHIMVETKKLAFADRLGYCGDPRTVDFPLQSLISKEFANARRRSIDRGRASGRSSRRTAGAARRRHDLLRGSRSLGQCCLVHSQPVQRVRQRSGGRGYGDSPEQPGRTRVYAGRRPP